MCVWREAGRLLKITPACVCSLLNASTHTHLLSHTHTITCLLQISVELELEQQPAGLRVSLKPQQSQADLRPQGPATVNRGLLRVGSEGWAFCKVWTVKGCVCMGGPCVNKEVQCDRDREKTNMPICGTLYLLVCVCD